MLCEKPGFTNSFFGSPFFPADGPEIAQTAAAAATHSARRANPFRALPGQIDRHPRCPPDSPNPARVSDWPNAGHGDGHGLVVI